jgi:hypothetical protein
MKRGGESSLVKSRALWSDPLFLKEMAAQARRRLKRGLTYPGLMWFFLFTHLPPIIFWRAGGQESGLDVRAFFSFSVLLQTWLVALRSSLYPAVSMACEMREGTVPVLLSTPLSLTRALSAKLVACLLPLWVEILAVQPLFFGFYVWAEGISLWTVLAVDGFLVAVSLLFGCLGLWLGSQLPEPERAANNAKLVVMMLLVGTLLLESLLTWPFLLVGSVVWMFLMSPSRPGQQSYRGLIYALVVVVSLPLLLSLSQGALYNFELGAFNPLRCVYSLGADVPANHLVPDLVDEARVREGGLDTNLQQLKANFDGEETHRRARHHLLPASLVYLGLAILLFRLTLGRLRQLHG